MKKSFKSLISILTVAMMLLAMVPGAFAKSVSNTPSHAATITPSSIAFIGTGASVVEGIDLKTMLTDDVFYQIVDTGHRSGEILTRNNNINKVAAFTAVDSGIQWTFDSAEVKRLDLWMLNCGGIGNYVVEYLNGDTWTKIAEGSLDKSDAASVTSDKRSAASYYPIVFSNGVTTTSVRFVIKSFSEANNNAAYISEAKIYSHNNINYVSQYFAPSNHKYNPYLYGFACARRTGDDKGTGIGNFNPFWPGSGTQYYNIFPNVTDTANYTTDLWYATTFNNSKVKVNKVGITLPSNYTGTVSQFEVWACENNAEYNLNSEANYQYKYFPLETESGTVDKDEWTKVATINCNMTKSTREQFFSIPGAFEAGAYLIVVTGYSDWEYKDTGAIDATSLPSFEDVEMYTVADSELPSEVYSQGISGTVDAGQTVTLNIGTNNLTNANAKVFFALYSGTELKDVTPVAKPLATSNFYTVDYQIPATAGDNLSVTAFVWDGTTLKPLLATPATATEAVAE